MNSSLGEIKAIKHDDEVAHSKEDDLHREFIQAVAESDHPLAEVAKVVLTTEEIRFARWCA